MACIGSVFISIDGPLQMSTGIMVVEVTQIRCRISFQIGRGKECPSIVKTIYAMWNKDKNSSNIRKKRIFLVNVQSYLYVNWISDCYCPPRSPSEHWKVFHKLSDREG